jgi:hypothetical protein
VLRESLWHTRSFFSLEPSACVDSRGENDDCLVLLAVEQLYVASQMCTGCSCYKVFLTRVLPLNYSFLNRFKMR